jgi:hypothetical protein
MKKVIRNHIKQIKQVTMICLVALVCAGCTNSKKLTQSYTFEVETGDTVKVSLDVSDKSNKSNKYKLKQKDGQFLIKNDKETLSQGIFITKDTYDQYVSLLSSNSDISVLEKDKTKGCSYLYEYKGEAGTEHDYVVWLNDSSTGILIGSLQNKKVAKDIFEKLTFEVK